MRSDEFWDSFNIELRPLLGVRAESFARMFEYLDQFDHPLAIVETGCTREPGNWGGDGCSTVLFDRYAGYHPGTTVDSVDIDPVATAMCQSLVSGHVSVHTGDSVAFLRGLADGPSEPGGKVDLLYLDSYDVNFDDPFPSAFHHIKELIAAAPLVGRETLVVVDDSPVSINGFFRPDGTLQVISQPRIGGKGKLVAEYAQHIGAALLFQGYQCGWTGMRNVENRSMR